MPVHGVLNYGYSVRRGFQIHFTSRRHLLTDMQTCIKATPSKVSFGKLYNWPWIASRITDAGICHWVSVDRSQRFVHKCTRSQNSSDCHTTLVKSTLFLNTKAPGNCTSILVPITTAVLASQRDCVQNSHPPGRQLQLSEGIFSPSS